MSFRTYSTVSVDIELVRVSLVIISFCNIYFGGGGESFSSMSGHGSCLPTFSHIHLLGGENKTNIEQK